MLLDLKNNNNK